MEKGKILVVEDAVIVAKHLAEALKGHGYVITAVVSSGEEAVQKAVETQPDLILMDISLAKQMDGIEAATQIRTRSDAPIIYLTAYGDDKTLQRAKVTGPSGYLIKPFEERELFATVEMALYKYQIEQKLKESEARFADILDIAPDAIITVDSDQRIQVFNQGAEQIFGYHAEEVLGQPLDILLPSHLVKKHRQHIHNFAVVPEAARRMETRQVEIFGRRQDGVVFPAEVSISKLVRNGGTIYTAILRDITERKRIEDELRLLLAMTQEISSAPDFQSALGNALRLICETTGWEYGEAWIPLPDDTALVCSPIWFGDAEKLGKFRQLSTEYRFPLAVGLPGRVWESGQPEWVPDISQESEPLFLRSGIAEEAGLKASYAVPIIAGDDRVAVLTFLTFEAHTQDMRLMELVVAVGTQISTMLQQKQAEESLHKLSSVVKQTADTVVITDKKGVIEYVNQSFAELSGYTREEAVGKMPNILKSDQHTPEFYTKIWQTILADKPFHAEFVNRKKNGELFYEDKTISPLKDREGNLTHFVATGKDVTEYKRLEDQLEAIYTLGRELTLYRNEADIVEKVLVTATDLIQVKTAICGLVDKAADELENHYGIPKPVDIRLPLAGDRGISVAVVRSGQAIIVPDTLLDPRYVPVPGQSGRSELCVPMQSGERIIGVLDVESAELNHFTPEDQQLLQALANQTAVALENVWLFEQVEQRNVELNHLYRALKTLFSSTMPNVPTIAQIIVETVLEEFEQPNCSLILVKQGANELARIAIAGPFAKSVSHQRLTLDGPGLVPAAIRSGQILNVPDVLSHSNYLPNWKDTRSELTIPLKIGPLVIGAIDVQSTQPKAFDAEDERLLSIFAERAALALENARLHQQAQQEIAQRKQSDLALSQRNRELYFLHRAGQQLGVSLNLSSVFRTALDEVRTLLNSTACSIWLRDSETDEIVCQEVSSPQDIVVRGWRLAPGQGVIGWVVQHNQSLLINNTRHDDRFFSGVDEATRMVSHSTLTVPLKTIQGNMGAIQVLDEQIAKFGDMDLRLVEALADSIASAIENARLYTAEREQRRLAETLRDTAAILNKNLDLEQVLDHILANVERIVPCDIVNIMLVDSGMVRMVHYRGFTDYELKGDFETLRFSIDGVSCLRRMAATGQPYIIPDTSKDPDWVQLTHTYNVYVHTSTPIQSYIGTPIQRDKKVIGFINVNNFTANTLTVTHMKQLQDFANQSAMAIHNAQLYQQSQQEVADRLAAEKEVQRQNEFLNVVISSLTHPFYVVNVKDYSVVIANEAARKAGVLEGATCYAATHGRDAPCDGKDHPCPIKQILKTRQPTTVEHLHYASAGNPRNIMVYSYPIHDQDGAITQIIEYTIDITEQVQSGQMLIQSEKFAATGKMAAAVAHEIKNPLQSLLGCLGLAEEAVRDGRDAGKYFDVARDSVQRISGTVTQMRELYRPATVNKRAVDINMLLDRLLTLIEKQCADSNVEIIWWPAQESPPLMLVFDEIHQVFLNLALNAIEAMPDGGELHMGTDFVEEPAGMQVVIADNGIGIAPDVLDRIFEPFYTTKSHGSGLGLATSFGIIKGYGGQIDVVSQDGVGSVFTVWLPL